MQLWSDAATAAVVQPCVALRAVAWMAGDELIVALREQCAPRCVKENPLWQRRGINRYEDMPEWERPRHWQTKPLYQWVYVWTGDHGFGPYYNYHLYQREQCTSLSHADTPVIVIDHEGNVIGGLREIHDGWYWERPTITAWNKDNVAQEVCQALNTLLAAEETTRTRAREQRELRERVLHDGRPRGGERTPAEIERLKQVLAASRAAG